MSSSVPAKGTKADPASAAGAAKRALCDARCVARYNFMNRFIEGLGLTAIPAHFDMEGKLIKDGGYNGMIDAFGIT